MGLCSLEYGSEFPDELLLKRRDGSELDRCRHQACSAQLRRFLWTGSFWLPVPVGIRHPSHADTNPKFVLKY